MPKSCAIDRTHTSLQNDWDWPALVREIGLDFERAPEILAKAGLSIQKLRGLSVPSITMDQPYGRHVLFQTDQCEVMLASWSKGAECAPHDHGFSKGLVWLVDGNFRETHYELGKNLSVLGKSILRKSGTILNVTPGDIHSMVALDGGISLHIYSPAIQDMKVFDPNLRRTLSVTGDCGAWVPTNKNQIISEEAWS
ncbi:MAG: hypothetical protein EOP04_26955 [Proteobacteria bacterium]|nr:MAG: hypothetical protein EOP04_26955 [Pseudomonadota bacterium]